MKKSEGYDLVMQLSYARRMFCFKSLQAIHLESMLFDDLGLIRLCENGHNEMVREMRIWIKNYLLIHFGLDWIPKPFRESAYYSLMLLIRLGIDKHEIQKACAALSDRYQDYEWKDIFTDEFSNQSVKAMVILPIRSDLLFSDLLMTPVERKLFYFHHDKGQVLEALDEYLTPSLAVYPVGVDQSQCSSYHELFKRKTDETGPSVTTYMDLEEIAYAYLLSIISFHGFGIAQQQSDHNVSPGEAVVKAYAGFYIHYRDNFLEIRTVPPEIELEPGEYRVPMYVV